MWPLPGRARYARSGTPRIAYRLRGRYRRRRRWLVLVQGLGFDHSGWDPVIKPLSRHFRLVLVDNRGSGRSTIPPAGFSVAHLARDVVAVLDAARIRTAHVVGTSLGGMVAQEVAIRYPDRVDRLVLASTTPGWPYAYPMPAASVRLMAQTGTLDREVALRRHTENALAADTVAGRPDLVERLVAHQRARPMDRRAWAAQAAAGARYSGGRRQRMIRAPALVLHGTADRVVDPRNGALLASRIPGARLVTLPGLGHLFFWEDPERFAAVVASFLLEGQAVSKSDTAIPVIHG